MELMNRTDQDAMETRETLLMMGGLALVVLGAGMIVSSPMVRRLLGNAGVGSLLQAAGPDLERYLRLKSM
jgi:hypothetical protein